MIEPITNLMLAAVGSSVLLGVMVAGIGYGNQHNPTYYFPGLESKEVLLL